MKTAQDKYHGEKDRLFNKNDFVDLIWPLVALPGVVPHHEKAKHNKLKKRAQIQIQPTRFEV